jgi:hypothetical protein
MQRLGVAVGANEIRVILLQSGVIRWYSRAPFCGVENASDCLKRLLVEAPHVTSRLKINVALGPAWVQTKRLYGLPPARSLRVAEQLVEENQRAFFLWKGAAGAATGVHVLASGQAWGAAFAKDMLDELVRCLQSHRRTVSLVAPALVLVVAAMPGVEALWRDGDECFVVEGDVRGLRRADRTWSCVPNAALSLPEPLAVLGDEAFQFLDAYGAAIAPGNISLAWRPSPTERRLRFIQRIRTAAGAAAVCAAIAFAAFAPGIHANRIVRDSERELARGRNAQVGLSNTDAELRRVTDLLNRVEAFRRERGGVTRVLGELSQAIPESTALLAFHIDSAEGGFTAISPHVADVLPGLTGVSHVVEPRLVGSIAREILNGTRVERATFRFRRVRPVIARTRVVR